MINFAYEKPHWQNGLQFVAGVDEAGRGPWAGPVVAGAVIFTPDFKNEFLSILNDSKKLSIQKRQTLYQLITQHCDYAVGISTVAEIDNINILQASMLAMHRAVNDLASTPQFALIDGNKIPTQLKMPAQAIVKGDAKSFSIAAGSIIAKVTRDALMSELHIKHPHYGWDTNQGYGTKKHQIGLAKHGATQHHRKSFKPIAAILNTQN